MQLQDTPTIASPGQSGVAREGAKEPGRPHRRVSSGGAQLRYGVTQLKILLKGTESLSSSA